MPLTIADLRPEENDLWQSLRTCYRKLYNAGHVGIAISWKDPLNSQDISVEARVFLRRKNWALLKKHYKPAKNLSMRMVKAWVQHVAEWE